MELLVLGGTEFVGQALVSEALGRGWNVTVFNRGTHPAPAGTTLLRGDRTRPGGLAELAGGRWDAVVDTWSWAPAAVHRSATALAGRADRYAYVSSRSVYRFPPAAGADESAPLGDGSPDDETADDYARAKRGGEMAATAAFGEAALLLRAGLILGPHENVGRLPWWLTRIARGGPVLAPGPADLGVQYIDVRDLASWTLTALAAGAGGAYNLVGPPDHTTTEDLLRACVEVTGADADLRWADPDVIAAAGIEPWTDLPTWMPPGELHDAMHRGDVSKAVAAGLTCRDVTATVADTWGWLQELGGTPPRRADRPPVGLAPELEAAVLRELP